jgi:hypothetical protein
MYNEQGWMDIAAFPQQGHRTLERIEGRLEDQGVFIRREPTGVIPYNPLLDTKS